jgi:hypothetical protein
MLGSASRRTSGVLLATIALTLVACERPTVIPPDPEPARLAVSANVAATAIATMVVKVTATDIANPLVFNMAINNGMATGTLAVPAGSARRLELDAYDANQIKTHRGEKTIDVKPGNNNPALAVVLLPIAGDQPVTAQFGNFIVTVSPPTHTLIVGGSQPFTVKITDNATPVANEITPAMGEVKWATTLPAGLEITVSPTDPRVASVKALLPGAGKVGDLVATYNGVAGTATVTVP